ncbi:GNAT family N-acetyltransferase [Bradyrhizobium sp. STM 3561]|uniref:GNAT family N-acetyltransferase n=1 Tax=Bradyrhizobium sp. STM 3561 TaxID=578923 RepID=UPI00388FB5DA
MLWYYRIPRPSGSRRCDRTFIGTTAVLDSFFLPRQLRGRGLGNAILKTFEEEGRQRGCRSAFLYTVNLPDFYTRNGWKAFGRTPCDPPGAFRVFMTKSLEARS